MEKWRKQVRDRNFENSVAEKKTLDRFKSQHPVLMKLNPEVTISNYIKIQNGKEIEELRIDVNHSFIFDRRLIPEKFENIEVIGIWFNPMPKEFPSECAELRLENYYAPERYERFVSNNLELLRKKLNNDNLTSEQALDALTGDFNKHKKWAENMRKNTEIEHKEHVEFFKELLKKTGQVFKKSDIYKNYGDKEWWYSIAATCLAKNRPLIIGFNWGVEKGVRYVPQSKYVYEDFGGLYDELGSFKRVISMAENYSILLEILRANQTNYCFFRSEKESQISSDDLKMCKPIFNELIEYLEPSKIINFSRQLNDYFEKSNRLVTDKIKMSSNKRSIIVSKGFIKIEENKIQYYNLPHPNYPIKGEVRKKAWDYCFEE